MKILNYIKKIFSFIFEEINKIKVILTHNKFKLLILVILLIAGYLFYISEPPKDFPINKIISIEEGRSIKSIALNLKEEQIIKSSILFQLLIQFSETKSVKAGDYLFDTKINIFQVARKVETGNFNIPIIKVTITEGMTVEDIADRLSSKLMNFNKDSFMKLAQKYEGYLFPDTYNFNFTEWPLKNTWFMA